jgi:hypothetical protein
MSFESLSRPSHLAVSALGPVALGVALASADTASAQVIVTSSDPPSSVTTSGSSATLPFHIGTLGTGDPFTLTAKPLNYPGPGSQPAGTLSANSSSGFAIAGPFSAGTLIDGSTTFSNPTFGITLNPGTNYFGFSFTDSSTRYGWISSSFSTDGTNSTVTLNGWGYENTGAGILAGQTSAIPEPANVAAGLALLAGSAAMWHRRRQAQQKKKNAA